MRLFAIPALVALAALFSLGDAAAAPPLAPDRPLDIEMRAADVTSVFTMLGEISQRPVVLDSCVKGTVDLRMKNTPLRLLYDALALKLHLVYRDDGAHLYVGCVTADAAREVAPETRISVTANGASLDDVLRELSAQTTLQIDYRATSHPVVTMTLMRVKTTTVAAALAESTGLSFAIVGDKLVVTDH